MGKNSILKTNHFLLTFLLAALGWLTIPATANAADSTRPTVTVLLPLQLDSLFKYDQFKFANSIPKFALPYLEFYNGVQYAADTLRKEGTEAHINVVDTRKAGKTVAQILQDPAVKEAHLLIAVGQSGAEIKMMADYARQINVPLISATYPNDGGVRGNENFFMANSSLRTHCHGIYKYLQQNHATSNIIAFTRKGNFEPYLKSWLDEAAAQSASVRLRLQYITLTDSFSVSNVQTMLDSTRQNVLLGVTLDEAFSKRLVQSLSALAPNYQSLVMGMPTWDEIDFRRLEFKGVEVMYSTPFVSLSANIDAYNAMAQYYNKNLNSRPSDMALKGYELTYRYIKTLTKHPYPEDFARHANDGAFKVFCDFNFQPVRNPSSAAVTVEYYENKKLYFVRKLDGNVKGIY
jgi:hypothetical protein